MPYIIFGHSLGASLGFEICKLINLQNQSQPLAFFVGDRESPSFKPEHIRHDLPEVAFLKMLNDDYDMDERVTSNKDLMEMFRPILRSEIKLAETYHIYHQNQPDVTINCPIFIFQPEKSMHEAAGLADWQKYTRNSASILPVSGGHFFNFDSAKDTIAAMVRVFYLPD